VSNWESVDGATLGVVSPDSVGFFNFSHKIFYSIIGGGRGASGRQKIPSKPMLCTRNLGRSETKCAGRSNGLKISRLKSESHQSN